MICVNELRMLERRAIILRRRRNPPLLSKGNSQGRTRWRDFLRTRPGDYISCFDKSLGRSYRKCETTDRFEYLQSWAVVEIVVA